MYLKLAWSIYNKLQASQNYITRLSKTKKGNWYWVSKTKMADHWGSIHCSSSDLLFQGPQTGVCFPPGVRGLLHTAHNSSPLWVPRKEFKTSQQVCWEWCLACQEPFSQVAVLLYHSEPCAVQDHQALFDSCLHCLLHPLCHVRPQKDLAFSSIPF